MKMHSEAPQEIALLTTDIRQYSTITANMAADQIRDFMFGYYNVLQSIILDTENQADEFEPFAGDSSIAVFKQRTGENPREKCKRALKAALAIARAVEAQKISFTRIGLYAGEIIESEFGKVTLRFGNCFAVVNRLQELCEYFGTTILMDRTIAQAQDDEAQFIVAVGKVTPKGLEHPIHVYSVYKPGIHNCPPDIDSKQLQAFIQLKNEGIEYVIGNSQRNIPSNFQFAENKLLQAQNEFQQATGRYDVATLRILDYIHENPYPMETFEDKGIAIDEKQGKNTGIRLPNLSQQLIKAFNPNFYHALVENTGWDTLFLIQWFKQGETIIRVGDEPNGIYYLARGEVMVQDKAGNMITKLSEGDIFGEMSYFSSERTRSATVVAVTDIAVRKISSEDFEKTPILQHFFSELAKKRLRPV
jgi:class 3 adenylate cyclase